MRRARTIATAAALLLGALSALSAAPTAVAASGGDPGAWNFVSAPTLHPPVVTVDARSGRLAPGYVMVATFKNILVPQPIIGQGGPLILDNSGDPVWVQPVPASVYALDLQAQTYRSKPVLSWWEGTLTSAGTPLSGRVYIADQHYRVIRTLTASGGFVFSPHDIVITPQGTALITAYKAVPMNLTPYGGPANGTIEDTAVQEVNIATGQLVWQWDALAHVNPGASYVSAATPGTWDAYHLNSIAEDANGNLLLSMRDTYAIYEISHATGAIEWQLGGKDSSFTIGPGAAFAFQHDARFLPNGEISLFDDECCAFLPSGKAAPPVNGGSSRGLILKLNSVSHTASVVAQYLRGALVAGTQGSMQVLPNGDAFVGWGAQPFFSEFSSAGKLIFDVAFPSPDLSYRARRQVWTGLPLYGPSGAARRVGGHTIVYASWNGATRVAAWRLLSGSNSHKLAVAVKTTPRHGFETAIGAKRGAQAFQVEALDSRGRVIGHTKPFRVES